MWTSITETSSTPLSSVRCSEISNRRKNLNESKIHNSKSNITRPSEPVLGNYEAQKTSE